MQESACSYGECDGSGFVYDEPTNTQSDCRCRPERIARRSLARALSPVPKRYRDVAWDRNPIAALQAGVRLELERYVGNIAGHLDAGEGLWLEGASRLGKTSAAALIGMEAVTQHRTVLFYPTVDLLLEIKDTFREGSRSSTLELRDMLTSVDLLILDDLAAANATPWVNETIYGIVNKRYNEELAIVVTTDLGVEELCAQFDKRTVNRLLEMCGRPVNLQAPLLKAVGQ